MIRAIATLVAATLAAAITAAAPAALSAEAPSAEAQLLDFLEQLVDEPGTVIDIPRLPISHGERDALSVRFSVHPKRSITGVVPVRVMLHEGDVRIRSFAVSALVSRSQRVLVTRHRVPARQTITSEDVVMEDRSSTRLPRDTVSDPERVLGLRTRRTLAAGTLVRKSYLDQTPDVERGDPVKLFLKSGGLIIETSGRAEQDGVTGDWIRVRNHASRRIVIGRVGSDGAVHVEP